jgi:hypothetical protein
MSKGMLISKTRVTLPLLLAVGVLTFGVGSVLSKALVATQSTTGDAQVPAEFVPAVEPLRHKNYTEKLPDSKVEFEMIAIPGGTFLMGSPDDETGRQRDEGPQHPVKVLPFLDGQDRTDQRGRIYFSGDLHRSKGTHLFFGGPPMAQ